MSFELCYPFERMTNRKPHPGRALEDRNRQQLYEVAKQKGIAGRSRMGKWDLIEVRKSR